MSYSLHSPFSRFSFLVVLLLMTGLMAATDVAEKLFVDVSEEVVSSKAVCKILAASDGVVSDFCSPVRRRVVNLNLNALRGKNITLNLFDELCLVAEQDSSSTPANVSEIWTGHVKDAPTSQVTLVVRNKALAGTVRIGDKLFKLMPFGNSMHIIEEVLSTQHWECSEPPAHPKIDKAKDKAPDVLLRSGIGSDILADDGSVIDVLVVYTSAAVVANHNSGHAGMQALIELAIVESNQAYANSLIIPRLNLVHTAEVNFVETSSNKNQNFALTALEEKGDGLIDEVHNLRDLYHADMVVMIVGNGTGVGSHVDDPYEGIAFSVVGWYYASANYAFVHELGHNMGLNHDRAQEILEGRNPNTAKYPYAYGYVENTSSNFQERFRDIMSYPQPRDAPLIQYFSNPNVNYIGKPTGVANQADGARRINEVRSIVANFRTRVSTNTSVMGNGELIASGDVWPSAGNRTSFGSVAIGQTLEYTYTINNTGGSSLNLTGTPRISINGANATMFTVTQQPSTPVTAGGTTSFKIQYSPTATGAHSATVAFANSDSTVNPYTFAINNGIDSSQTAASVVVTPALGMVNFSSTQQFTATVLDGSGNALTPQPAIIWSLSASISGTINGTGLFTANTTAGGPYTVTATSSGRSGTATVTVTGAGGIIARWKCDADSGTTLVDDVGTNQGILMNGTTWVTGRVGGSVSFNGTNNYVNISTPSLALSNQVTIALWTLGGTSQPQASSVLYATDAAGNRTLNLHLPWSDGTVYWDAGNVTANVDRLSKAATTSQYKGQWNHWVFTKNATAGTMAIYLNGTLWASTGSGMTKNISTITSLTLGNIGTNYYSGQLDDICIYNIALDATAVSVLYNSYPAITTQPQAQTIVSGATATLSITATGSGLTYQWYQGNSGITTTPMASATAASYTTPALVATTSYWVKVSNGAGNVNSSTAIVAVTTGNTPPTVATAATATPNPVTGMTTTLNVLGTDNGGEPALVYTWSATGTPPASVTFSPNGTNAAKASMATFTKAGSYMIQCTIKDAGNLTVISSVAVTVNQTITTVAVSPTTPGVHVGSTQTFTASGKDQFGTAMSNLQTFTWSVSSGATISSGGVVSAITTAGGSYAVTASSGGKTGTTTFTVINDRPTISAIADQSVEVSTVTSAITFTIGDPETAAASLTLTMASSDSVLVPLANIVLGGSGANRTVTVTPATGLTGVATITLSVKDAQNAVASETFNVSIGASGGGGTSDGGGKKKCGLGLGVGVFVAMISLMFQRIIGRRRRNELG